MNDELRGLLAEARHELHLYRDTLLDDEIHGEEASADLNELIERIDAAMTAEQAKGK